MRQLLEQLYARWRTLQPRERIVLGSGATLALVMLGYALFWVPLQRDLSHLRTAVPKERAVITSYSIHYTKLYDTQNSA